MLVLSRKLGQKLRIADHIEIEVRKISRNRVSLGISAPSEVQVVRTEIEDDGDTVLTEDGE